MAIFTTKKAEVFDHWIGFAHDFSFSSSAFYDLVQNELAARQVPRMEMSRVEFSEGGLLSDKRAYLRMIRERLVFDVCACPFGTGYFFSCRAAEIPAVVKPWEIAVLLFFLYFLLYVAVDKIGVFLGPFVLLVFLAALVYVLRNAVALGLADLDTTLIRTPVLGPVYEAWIRKDSYYRQDTRLMYLDMVPKIVQAHAEAVTGAKGIRLVRQYRQNPLLGGSYQRIGEQSPPTPEPTP